MSPASSPNRIIWTSSIKFRLVFVTAAAIVGLRLMKIAETVALALVVTMMTTPSSTLVFLSSNRELMVVSFS